MKHFTESGIWMQIMLPYLRKDIFTVQVSFTDFRQ